MTNRIHTTIALLLVAATVTTAPARAEDAPADSTATAYEDSIAALFQAQQAEPVVPFITSWDRKPSFKTRATMRSVNVTGAFDNDLLLRGGHRLNQKFSMGHEDYRTQEKFVDKRDANVTYSLPQDGFAEGTLNLIQNWSEDHITNSSGSTTVNKRDYRQARVTAKKEEFELGGLLHDLSFNASATDQQAEQQNQRSDFSESRLDGHLASQWTPADGVTFHTGAFAMTEAGERALGLETNPSSADGDSLRAAVGVKRGGWVSSISFESSSFRKQYLDYRRNTNGVVDTIGVDQKIVEELERDDAVVLAWRNDLDLGPVKVSANVIRDVSENSFRMSGVGTREKRTDTSDLTVSWNASESDSLSVSYAYLWRWDDQTYLGAAESRGRQNYGSRTVKLGYLRHLFEHTDLTVNLTNGITQDIAENRYNENDRDRIDMSANVALETLFDNAFQVGMVFDAKQVEDVSIRSSRSANNSIKNTYEINPSYLWPVASWLDLSQSFRVWIQYTDYVFSHLENVNKQDDFNKRGNMETRLTLRPNSRVTVVLTHNYNIKLLGKKSTTDVTGHSTYFRESDQRINKIDVSVTYKPAKWLTLDGTTYKSRDFKESFGPRPSELERYSGEVGVGGTVSHKFSQGKQVSAAIRKFFAHGPSVQEAGRDYWDADIQFSWRF